MVTNVGISILLRERVSETLDEGEEEGGFHHHHWVLRKSGDVVGGVDQVGVLHSRAGVVVLQNHVGVVALRKGDVGVVERNRHVGAVLHEVALRESADVVGEEGRVAVGGTDHFLGGLGNASGHYVHVLPLLMQMVDRMKLVPYSAEWEIVYHLLLVEASRSPLHHGPTGFDRVDASS